MEHHLPANQQSNKAHCVCVPFDIHTAIVELLKFRGLPVFVGSELAILHFGQNSLVLYSTISGVVDRVLVDNNDTVTQGQRIFEIRNTNINREKSGNQMQQLPGYTPKPNFLITQSKNMRPRTKSASIFSKNSTEYRQIPMNTKFSSPQLIMLPVSLFYHTAIHSKFELNHPNYSLNKIKHSKFTK